MTRGRNQPCVKCRYFRQKEYEKEGPFDYFCGRGVNVMNPEATDYCHKYKRRYTVTEKCRKARACRAADLKKVKKRQEEKFQQFVRQLKFPLSEMRG